MEESRPSQGDVQTSWGILKSSHDKFNTNSEAELAGVKDQPVQPLGGTSRVSFRLENEVQVEEDAHEHDVEAEADREVEAITGKERMSPGDESEVLSGAFCTSLWFALASASSSANIDQACCVLIRIFSLDQSIQSLLYFVKSNINRNFVQKRSCFSFLFFLWKFIFVIL